MEHFEERECLTNLIALQVSYQMPAESGRQFGYFCLRLLNSVLAKQQLTRFKGLPDQFRRMCLTDGHELDGPGGPSGCALRFSNLHPDEVQIFSEVKGH